MVTLLEMSCINNSKRDSMKCANLSNPQWALKSLCWSSPVCFWLLSVSFYGASFHELIRKRSIRYKYSSVLLNNKYKSFHQKLKSFLFPYMSKTRQGKLMSMIKINTKSTTLQHLPKRNGSNLSSWVRLFMWRY